MVETQLLRCLRIWQTTPNAIAESGRTLIQEICSLLEAYICGCIAYGPKNLTGWWSDGVVHLEVENRVADQFKLLGVTWIDSLGLAPFEFDLELDSNDRTYFARTTFRIGRLDDAGRPTVASRNLAPSRVLETRPRQNCDWAMAVELTPMPKVADEQGE